MKKVVLGVASLLALSAAMPAAAATFLVNFTSPKFGSSGPFTGSMTLTTADVASGDGSYAILGITGSGVYKTKSYTYAGPTLYNNADNKLFADRTGRVFDIDGAGFTMTSGASVLSGNLFYYGSTTNAYMWSVGADSGIMSSFTITKLAAAVPETATWIMMILGIGVIGGVLRGRRATVPLAV